MYRITDIQGYSCTGVLVYWCQVYWCTEILVYRDTCVQGLLAYMDTSVQGYWFTGVQGYW